MPSEAAIASGPGEVRGYLDDVGFSSRTQRSYNGTEPPCATETTTNRASSAEVDDDASPSCLEQLISACRQRLVDPVWFFEDAEDEAAYVAFAHRGPWLRVGAVLSALSFVGVKFTMERGRVLAADEASPVALWAWLATTVIATAVVLATLPKPAAALRRVCGCNWPTEGGDAAAFEAALVAAVLTSVVVDRFFLMPAPVAIEPAAPGRESVAVGILPVAASIVPFAPSPPRFCVVMPFLLLLDVAQVVAVLGFHVDELAGGALAAGIAVTQLTAYAIALAVALWAWEAQRRATFRQLQRNAARTDATSAIVEALCSASSAADPSSGTVAELSPAQSLHGCAVVFRQCEPSAPGTTGLPPQVVLAALTALQRASFATAAAMGLRLACTVVARERIVVVISTAPRYTEKKDDADKTDGKTESQQKAGEAHASMTDATVFAQAVLRLAGESVENVAFCASPSHRPTSSPLTQSFFSVPSSPSSPETATLTIHDGSGASVERADEPQAPDGIEFAAAVTAGAIEIAHAPVAAPAGATAVTGDAVRRALLIASVCAPAGKVVVSEEVRAAIASDFATTFVRNYHWEAPDNGRAMNAGKSDEGSSTEQRHEAATRLEERSLAMHVRGMPWSAAAQQRESRLREGRSVIVGSNDTTERSTRENSPVPDVVVAEEASSVELQPRGAARTASRTSTSAHRDGQQEAGVGAGQPVTTLVASFGFRFRFPWGYLFDDAAVEKEFRAIEHAGPKRWAVGAVALAQFGIVPVFVYLDGSNPTGVGVALWGMRSAAAVAGLGLCALRAPGQKVLAVHAAVLVFAMNVTTRQWYGAMHSEARVPLYAVAQMQSALAIHVALLLTPSVLPWPLLYFLDLVFYPENGPTDPNAFMLPPLLLFACVAVLLLGVICGVYGDRARQRTGFAAVRDSELALEAWAARRARLEHRLELLTWPCVARQMCDAVAAARPAESLVWRGEVYVARVAVRAGRGPASASELREAALAAYADAELRALGAAVVSEADAVEVIVPATQRFAPEHVASHLASALSDARSPLRCAGIRRRVAVAELSRADAATPASFAFTWARR